MPLIPVITQDQTAGETGRVTSFDVTTLVAVSGDPLQVRLDWVNNGSLTDAYEVKLYESYDPVEYSDDFVLIHTEGSPSTTSVRDHTTPIVYNPAGPRWFFKYRLNVYGPSGALLQTVDDFYSSKGYA